MAFPSVLFFLVSFSFGCRPSKYIGAYSTTSHFSIVGFHPSIPCRARNVTTFPVHLFGSHFSIVGFHPSIPCRARNVATFPVHLFGSQFSIVGFHPSIPCRARNVLEAPDWAPLFLQKSDYERGILTQNRQWAGILQASYFISEGLAGPPGIFFLQLVLTLLAKP